MRENVFIKETDSKFLEFFAPKKHYSLNQLGSFSVRFTSQNIEAVVHVYAYEDDGHRLAELFHDLALNWKGWDGEMGWAALDGDPLQALSMGTGVEKTHKTNE